MTEKKERIPENLKSVAGLVQDDDNLLSLDDEIEFKCGGCGKCCVDTTDIILTPVDLYNMANELNITTKEVVNGYGKIVLGGNTGLPIVLLKRDRFNRCLLLKNKKCTVHLGKPGACYLFPLGRVIKGNSNDGIKYFMQPELCNHYRLGKKVTIRDYIGEKYVSQEQACMAWLSRYGKLSSEIIGDFKEFIENTRMFLKNPIITAIIETLYVGLEDIESEELYEKLNERYDRAEELVREAKELETYYYDFMEKNNLFTDDEEYVRDFYSKMDLKNILKEYKTF